MAIAPLLGRIETGGKEGRPMCEVCGDPMHKLDDDSERATTQSPVSTVTTPNGYDHPQS